MKTQKMSLANAQGKLSRKEMKNIMGGSVINCGGTCTIYTGSGNSYGHCVIWNNGLSFCGCSAGGYYSETCRGR